MDSIEPIVQDAGELEKEVKLEEAYNFNGYYEQPLSAADQFYEPTPQEGTYGYYQLPEEDRKPFDQDNLFEDVKDSDTIFDVNFIGSFAPSFEGLQNEVKIEDEWEDCGFRREEMLNTADLLESGKNEPAGGPVARLLFTCLVKNCPFSYARIKELEQHMDIHPDDSDFFCDVCTSYFSSKEEAMEHIRLRESKVCCECGKTFSRANALMRHLRCHSGEKPFLCKICGKEFARQCNLSEHESRHTAEKSFICGHCGKRFVLKKDLKRHERIHTDDKPYSCGSCEERFHYARHLKSHEWIHTGKKPFECSHCSRGFMERSNLAVHVRIHTGQKPFPCEKCDQKFSRCDYLKKHVKNKHQT